MSFDHHKNDVIIINPNTMDVVLAPDLAKIDTRVRQRDFQPRAIKEESGVTNAVPKRAIREAAGYWFTRELTHRILGISYRTPQFNLALLEDYINSRIEEPVFRVRSFSYVARGFDNLQFDTAGGKIKVNAREHIDPVRFLARFGLTPEKVFKDT